MQAQWAEDTGDWKAAVELYLAAAKHTKAVTIYGEKGWIDQLIDLTRTFDKYVSIYSRAQCETHHSFVSSEITLKPCRRLPVTSVLPVSNSTPSRPTSS